MADIAFDFCKWEKKTPNEACLRQPFGENWEIYTWSQVGQMARKIATGLQSLNLPKGSHIGLISKNCREWIIADLAIMFAGYVSVPLYPTLKANSAKELIEIGDINAIFLGKIEDWDGMKDGIPDDIPAIRFPHYEGNGKVDKGEEWFSFIEKHEPLQGEPTFKPEDTWTIIFTSGTTGTPKGVVLTYATMDSTKIIVKEYNVVKISTEGDNKFFSFLPLNHIAERVVVEHNLISYGGSVSFSESLATFVKNLQDVQPTLFFAVPRIWTKFQLGVLSKMPQKKLDTLLKIPILSGVIKKKLRTGLGLNDARACLSGAAAIPESLMNWYRKIGIPISEGYGMTENCALTTNLAPGVIRPGSVGKALPNVELKIDEETSEILMSGPFVMKEYYKDPIKTAETITDGWLHTGDQGRIDSEGYLYITGRVKDTFKTGKGQFIVPGPIERKFENSENVEQICLCGLGCPQPLALIVPSEIGNAKPKDQLKQELTELLTSINDTLPSYQKVSTVVLVKDVWDVGNELLTPTLKVKRNKIGDRYNQLLSNWHEKKDTVVWEG